MLMQVTSLRHLFELFVCLALSLASVAQPAQTEAPRDDSPCTATILFPQIQQASLEILRFRSELTDPDVAVTQPLIMALSRKTLIAGGHIQGDSDSSMYALMGRHLDILLRSILQKKGEAQRASFRTLVENQFLRPDYMDSARQSCFQFAAASIFPTLPVEDQLFLLTSNYYPLFQSSSLTLYMRQLYESLDNQQPDSDDRSEHAVRFYRGLILRRIYEEDPVIGRAMILDEIASGSPRVDRDALTILPDETLPDVDNVARHQLSILQPGESDYASLAILGVLERYGTTNLLPVVKSAYIMGAPRWTSDEKDLLLSYLLRTDPTFVKQMIRHCVKTAPVNCLSVFTGIASVRSSKGLVAHVRSPQELNTLAEGYIGYLDRRIAADAAYIFKWTGNASVTPELWKNLEVWHRVWAVKRPIPPEEQDYEDSLAEALLLGDGPCRSKETIERLRSLYIKGNSVNGNIRFPAWHDPIYIGVDSTLPSGPSFQVTFCNGFLNFDELKAGMPHFPAGTHFAWAGTLEPPTPPRLEPLFKELQSVANEHRMVLEGYVNP